jgi:non-homologous end joining protein Ku
LTRSNPHKNTRSWFVAKEPPRGENVVYLIDALRKSIGRGAATPTEAPKK